MLRWRRVWLLVLGAMIACGSDPALAPTTSAVPRSVSPWDWPGYGYDAQHTFHGRTTLRAADVPHLSEAWTFPTGDAVTATPTVVAGTVYVGSWDGWFYAVSLRTGRLRWKFRLHRQDAVKPIPGVEPRPFDSDGGLVTSSAWFEPAGKGRPDLVIFGGGYTLYALDARTGRPVWAHDYTGRPDLPPDPDHDDARIFSSPVVAGGKVIIGVDVDGNDGHRGYAVAADIDTGRPAWVVETDVDQSGRVLNDGCGSIWSSASVSPDLGVVYLSTSDCHFGNATFGSEEVFALRITDGRRMWTYRPSRIDRGCDFAFGASVNVGLDRNGKTSFVGVGGKDGTYYSLDPRTGTLRWKRRVVHGGVAGGFIATTSYDGTRVVGSTGIGDFGNFGPDGEILCNPTDPTDVSHQEPSAHGIDAATGRVAWQNDKSGSFGPTTTAGGLTFHGIVLEERLQVTLASSGRVLAELALPALNWSGIATVGNAIVFGTGSAQSGSPAGITAFTPDGTAPVVPTERPR